MPTPLTTQQKLEGLKELGVSTSMFREFELQPSEEKLEEIKKTIKAAYKVAVLRLHPDVPETGNAEKFRLITEVNQDIQNWNPLRFIDRRPTVSAQANIEEMLRVAFSFRRAPFYKQQVSTASTTTGMYGNTSTIWEIRRR
jgi:hypothetical protein